MTWFFDNVNRKAFNLDTGSTIYIEGVEGQHDMYNLILETDDSITCLKSGIYSTLDKLLDDIMKAISSKKGVFNLA